MKLTELQVMVVEKRLKESGMSYAPLIDELLDHACCLVEEQMALGHSFPEALDRSFSLISPEIIKSCQKQTNFSVNKTKILMKRISIVTSGLAASCLLFTTILSAQNLSGIMPLENLEITSNVGQRVHPQTGQLKQHQGVDFKAPSGTPVLATADGVVDQVQEDVKGYGKYIVIKHADNFSTKYAQLSEFRVTIGSSVKQGQVIGLVGNSGASTGPHLHFEVIKDQQAIDPMAVIKDS